MESRIARKVAALSGIAGPEGSSDDAGCGRSWFADYRRLTVVELGLGGPLRAGRGTSDGPEDSGLFLRRGTRYEFADGDRDISTAPLPSVTLRSYGPDTKAALVLTGANHVLEPVARAIRTGLADVRRQIDDACLLVAVAQNMLQEAFEAQPVLFLHGIQAGLIQRALGLSSMVGDSRSGCTDPVPLARLEFGWAGNEPDRTEPERLGILHDTWNDLVAAPGHGGGTGCLISFRGGAEFEQDQSFGLGGRTDRRTAWVTTLSELSEQYLSGSAPGCTASVAISHIDGTARATALVPRERQIELMLARLGLRLQPGPGPDTSGPPRTVALPVLDVSRWTGACLLDRRAVLLAHYYTIRAAGWLAGMRALNRHRDRAETALRFADLAAAADHLLDPDDALRLQLTAHGRAYALRYRACRGHLDDDERRRIVDALDRLVAATEAGRCSAAALLEQLHVVLVALGTYRYAAAWYRDGAVDRDANRDLRRLWATALRIRDELIADPPPTCELDRDHASYLIGNEDEADVLEGVRRLDGLVDDARRAARAGQRRDLHMSLLIFLRAVTPALELGLGTAEDRERWIGKVRSVCAELAGAATSAAGRTEPEPDNAVVVLLYRIAAARVAAATVPGRSPGQQEVDLAAGAVQQVITYTGVDDPCRARRIDDLRARQVCRLSTRWSAWCATTGR